MGRGRMDSKGWTLCIPSEVIDNWGIKCTGQSAHLMPQARRAGHYCPGLCDASLRSVSGNDGLWAFDTSSCFQFARAVILPCHSKRRSPGS
ncbi:hypothetical protein Pyn_01113 [Prunus yedoensis var. nudiflora]|uniref:Uncharacterized protein n=1 Tax=Prunus yedoensis var. nudiflora TaxID=2094558 RepID=A0A314UXG7_PRUYE|nr:hypothetical protein Pyn_01113 [Prunus yedoensis var. nudiflora]